MAWCVHVCTTYWSYRGLGVNRGMYNAQDAAWVANKWAVARSVGGEEPRRLVNERQHLYKEYTMQMHGKNRHMLRGYTGDNTRITSGPEAAAAKAYSADPATRYTRFKDDCCAQWAAGLPNRGPRASRAPSL